MAESARATAERLADGASLLGLSPREKEVARLRLLGRTIEATAHELQMSPRTVKAHLEHIGRKLGVVGPMGLANAAHHALCARCGIRSRER